MDLEDELWTTHMTRIEIIATPLAFALLDAVVTLVGQSDDYWSGDYSSVNELNLVGHALLSHSPQLFIWSFCGWTIVLTLLLRLAPRHVAIWMSMILLCIHAFGAATWLINFPAGIVWVALIAIVVRFGVYPRYAPQLTLEKLASD